MRFRILTLLFILTLFSITARADSAFVNIKSIKVEEILSVASVEELESLLYPTGMQLPTKYLDIFMFADVGEMVQSVDSKTLEFLVANYPSENNTYTFAECRAAQLFCAWHTILDSDLRSPKDIDVTSLRYNLILNNLNTVGEVSTVYVEDLDKLLEVVSANRYILDIQSFVEGDNIINYAEYRSLTSTSNAFGIIFSLGYDYLWDVYADVEPRGELFNTMVTYYNGLGDYLELLGLNVKETGKVFFTEEAAEYAPPIATEEIKPTDKSFEEPTPTPAVTTIKPSKNPTIEYDEVTSSNYISDFAGDFTTVGKAERIRNGSDRILVICGIAIGIIIVVYWVSDFIKRRKKSRQDQRW